jgi:tripartite-type tricarboxylate transporter receptor subunit TctC
VTFSLGSLSVAAQTPASDKPLRTILPVGPGSGVDTITRTMSPAVSKALGGQPIVIENLPGAGGISGTQAIVSARPDGQTIGIVSNNHVINPSVYSKMPFDSLADITPIMVVGSTPMVLVVNRTSCRSQRQGAHRGAEGKPGFATTHRRATGRSCILPPRCSSIRRA